MGNAIGFTNSPNAGGLTSTGYFYVRSDSTQTVSVANTFQRATLDAAPSIVGWVFDSGADTLNCIVPGTYLFHVTAHCTKTGGSDTYIEVQAVKDGAAIAQTTMGVNVGVDNEVHQIDLTFIESFTFGQIMTVDFTGSTTSSQLVVPSGVDSFTSLAITAVRIA